MTRHLGYWFLQKSTWVCRFNSAGIAHTYTHTQTHTHTHTMVMIHKNTYTHIHICTHCVCVCVCVYMCMQEINYRLWMTYTEGAKLRDNTVEPRLTVKWSPLKGGHLRYNRHFWMCGPYLHRLQYIQNPSRADTSLFRITDTNFGPIWACALANGLT